MLTTLIETKCETCDKIEQNNVAKSFNHIFYQYTVFVNYEELLHDKN